MGLSQTKLYAHTSFGSAAAPPDYVTLIVAIGESNSGGQAPNASATGAELAARPNVQIMQITGAQPNCTATTFTSLDIGTNNNLGHFGLNSTTHSWELELANYLDTLMIGDENPLYYVQCGQGGSTYAEWAEAHIKRYIDQARDRVTVAKAAIQALGKTPQIFYWMSFGINDEVALGTEAGSKAWVTNVIELISRLQTIAGGYAPVIMTKLMTGHTLYDKAISTICLTPGNLAVEISSSGAATQDANHWSYLGQKVMSQNFIAMTKTTLGTGATYYTTKTAMQAGTAVANQLANLGTYTAVNWFGMINTLETSNKLKPNPASGDPGGRAVLTIDNSLDWGVEIDFINQADTAAMVVYLDTDKTESYVYGTTLGGLAGIYHGPGTDNLTFLPGSSTGEIGIGNSIASYPAKIRMRKSGNDIVFLLQDGGTGPWHYIYRDVGRLTALTNLYLKVAFAVETTTQEIKAYAAGPGVSLTDASYTVHTSSFTAAAWDTLNSASEDGSHVLTPTSTSGSPGARAVLTIDNTKAWGIEIDYSAQADTDAVDVYIDDIATHVNWAGSSNLSSAITGLYHAAGSNNFFRSPSDTGLGAGVTSYPGKIRIIKDGNDAVYYKQNSGGNWYWYYRHVGALTGQTTLYCKALFIVPTLTQHIKVYGAGAGVTFV